MTWLRSELHGQEKQGEPKRRGEREERNQSEGNTQTEKEWCPKRKSHEAIGAGGSRPSNPSNRWRQPGSRLPRDKRAKVRRNARGRRGDNIPEREERVRLRDSGFFEGVEDMVLRQPNKTTNQPTKNKQQATKGDNQQASKQQQPTQQNEAGRQGGGRGGAPARLREKNGKEESAWRWPKRATRRTGGVGMAAATEATRARQREKVRGKSRHGRGN
jgi:hypothetical protein